LAPCPTYDIVVPTSGRASLAPLLASLCRGPRPSAGRVIVVHDRDGRGPAAARNAGWRGAGAEWVVFLDDDVVVPGGWREALADDLAGLPEHVAGSQGRIVVPLPADRRPTDWECNVSGLESARWATADMAYRRAALVAVGGFDERFPRAYREDADLGLRIVEAGFEIRRGRRRVHHPVRDARPWVSLRLQAGNADDALMRALHGRDWRARAGAPRGRLPAHVLTTAAGGFALAALAAGSRRAAGAAAAGWLAATAQLARARIAPGPRTAREIVTMTWTSALMPPLATFHRARGEIRARRLLRRHPGAPAAGRLGAIHSRRPRHRRPAGPAAGRLGAIHSRRPRRRRPAAPAAGRLGAIHSRRPPRRRPAAVLLDRDGTLIEDVPYNGDPAAVRPMPGAREALDRLRASRVRLAVVSNQSGIGRGLVTEADVAAVNARVEELLGPLDPWLVCPHAPGDGCGCRKPSPGLIVRAAEALGVAPADCVVVGDIGADMEAARAAGARGVLVPTPRTRPDEVAAAPVVADTLPDAVAAILGGRACEGLDGGRPSATLAGGRA
jgi:histidinol-phosphate phosphatase family protein